MDAYTDEMLGNPSIKFKLVVYEQQLKDLLSSDTCALVPQITFDFNTIEVRGGKFFKLDKRGWSDEPPAQKKGSLTSARSYWNYDWKCTPKPDVFWSSFCNSFPDVIERTRALNKFYQCFFPTAMEHKTPKLTFVGPKDSGKTTWQEILKAFIPKDRTAFIGKEKNFPLSMLNESTHLIVMDDWSYENMIVDVLKQVFQGGIVAITEKYKGIRSLESRCPFYITSNKLPDFGEHNDAVMCRLAVFHTRTIPNRKKKYHRWYKSHAMECLHFMAEEISRYRFYIEEEELF